MIFDYFDSVHIISLPHHKERLSRLTAQLAGKVRKNRLHVCEAIDGEKLPAPAYWGQGNGAFACLQSHVRLLQTIWLSGHQRALVLEDDAIFDPAAAEWLPSFFSTIPKEWAQLYLGGQHQRDPEIKGGYFIGRSINRTHAYAVQRKAIPKILQHILHAPDYIRDPWKHIDHQLESAHQRADWMVVCPEWWSFGQGENHSSINGRKHPDKWWDWAPADMIEQLPWVIVDGGTSPKQLAAVREKLHFGWTVGTDGMTDTGMQSGMKRRTRVALHASAKAISEEAWSMRRLPAVLVKDETQRQTFMETLKPQTATLEEAASFDSIKWSEALK